MSELRTFSELEYTRPDFEEIKNYYISLNEKVKNAKDYETLRKLIFEEQNYSAHLSTMTTIAEIRHTIDTSDKFYEEEDRVINEEFPVIMPYLQQFTLSILDCPFKKEIDEEFGDFYLKNQKLGADCFNEKNIELIQEENKLVNRYQRIMASCKINFEGEECNILGLRKFFTSPDRKVRKAAWKEYSNFFSTNEKEMGDIFDKLVKVRNQMGVNMGFKNYIPLGYMQQGRLDYNEEDVAAFRKQVQEVLVPFCSKIYEAQAKRIGVDTINCYDEEFIFTDGNAKPAGDREYLVAQAKKMYHDMSPETGEFIDFMLDHELTDLDNKPNKASTGYMTHLGDYKAPFVFSCFNGTTYDVEVLTHEMGHAFAGYMAMKTQPLSSQWSESTDIAEIHSMSMEQFAYPYAELFFKDKADKYRFQHLQEAITFVPFGVAVDEFQHIVYNNPEMTPDERTAAWHDLEKKYMPWRKYDGDKFFEKGGWWYHKIHIFHYPFYYINYTLTTMGAMEFKKKMHENKEECWKDYMTLCKVGSSLGYKDTLKAANLAIPFEEGSVKRAMTYAMNILEEQM